MTWPDGGSSFLCIDCLFTRYEDEMIETPWQDHSYKNIGDWYREAATFQDELDNLSPEPKRGG